MILKYAHTSLPGRGFTDLGSENLPSKMKSWLKQTADEKTRNARSFDRGFSVTLWPSRDQPDYVVWTYLRKDRDDNGRPFVGCYAAIMKLQGEIPDPEEVLKTLEEDRQRYGEQKTPATPVSRISQGKEKGITLREMDLLAGLYSDEKVLPKIAACLAGGREFTLKVKTADEAIETAIALSKLKPHGIPLPLTIATYSPAGPAARLQQVQVLPDPVIRRNAELLGTRAPGPEEQLQGQKIAEAIRTRDPRKVTMELENNAHYRKTLRGATKLASPEAASTDRPWQDRDEHWRGNLAGWQKQLEQREREVKERETKAGELERKAEGKIRTAREKERQAETDEFWKALSALDTAAGKVVGEKAAARRSLRRNCLEAAREDTQRAMDSTDDPDKLELFRQPIEALAYILPSENRIVKQLLRKLDERVKKVQHSKKRG